MGSAGVPMLGFLVIALVIVAAVLLIAGLGVAVGAGVLVGVALGFIAFSGVTFLARRDGSFGWSSSATPGIEADAAFLQKYGLTSARVADVGSGALTRVIPLGTEVEAGGVRVELIALELRTDGGIGALATHTRPPDAPPGFFADAHVTDDAGTEYVAAVQGGGQSSPSHARFELRFAPPPPPTARNLTIEIRRFMDPFPAPSPRPVAGPWSFTIALAPSTGDHAKEV
jgi:hypothetical protein